MTSDLYPVTPARPWTSRLYQTERDLAQMLDMLMEARARTSDWQYAHIGELAFNFFMVDCHLDPREHVRLWHNDEGRLIGYAMVGDDPFFDWQILPQHEWRGIEDEALAWAEAKAAELRARDAKEWGGPMVCGARQDNARRLAFLQQHGFRCRGTFSEVNMIRSLDDPIPAPAIPAGSQVRVMAADADEIHNRAEAYREVWHPWSVGDVSDEDYARFMRLPVYDRELDVVAVAPDGVIAAYVNGWNDPVNRIGDMGPVGARPDYRRQGYTRAVLLECLRRMRERGMERACVSTTVTNAAARPLYASVGFRIVNQYLDYTQTGSK